MLTWKKITLKLRNPFRLSYGTSEERQAYWIRLEGDQGWGEGTIPPYYHVSTQALEAYWQKAAQRREPFPGELERISGWIDLDGPAPARCALDLALHDRLAKQQRLPLWQILELPEPLPKPSSFTISMDTPEAMAAMACQVSQYPILKIKLGGDGLDLERLKMIRSARPEALIRVDANAGWSFEEAVRFLETLQTFHLELLEQPLAQTDIRGMGKLQEMTEIPIVADESIQTKDDIEALAKAGVKGINIKLMKVGGLGPALQMIRRARELGLKIMLGCMIETSIGLTAMAHLSGLAEWLDLDASMLVINDPFEGMFFDETAAIHVPDRPGIGARLKSAD